ncbi:MAG: response regulator transcription factor [Marinobacterium sp.]|nr:response regulator transcription factor [Marinobacterium sp.]
MMSKTTVSSASARSMSSRPRILLTDDDAMIRMFVGEVLSQHYHIETAATAEQAQDFLMNQTFDLMLLDLSLPDEDGLVVLRKLSLRCQLPVIVISGRSDDENRIAALEMGARDYLVKPFNPRELQLRIEKCLTYTERTDTRSLTEQTFGSWVLDSSTRTLQHRNDGEVRLTRAEFDLLAALVHAGLRVLSRPVLLEAISNGEQVATDSSLTVLVHRLRRKLENTNPADVSIQTVSGMGYRLNITGNNSSTV